MVNYRNIFIILLFASLLIIPLVTLGFTCRGLEVEIPGLTATCLPALPDYIVAIFNFALMSIGIICLGAFIYGGFSYLTSAGSPSAMNDAKDRIFSALLGLIILFSAWLILHTINPELVLLDTLIPIKCSDVAPCPPGQDCVGGICSTFPGGTPPSSPTCSSGYSTPGDCTRQRDPTTGNSICDWCPACSGKQVNKWVKDSCVQAGTSCEYSCQSGYCGATSAHCLADCLSYTTESACTSDTWCIWCDACKGNMANSTIINPPGYQGKDTCVSPYLIISHACLYLLVPGFCGM